MSTRRIRAVMAVAAVSALGVFAVAGPAQAGTSIPTKHNHLGTASSTHTGKQPSNALAPLATAAKPAGYVVVSSVALTSPANVQTHGSITCPSGKVPLGGGVFSSSGSVVVNVNSSYPTSTGWAADVNNASTTSSTFTVYAVCAKTPKRYALITGASDTVNPGTQVSSVLATCPQGRPISGGIFSNSSSLLANLNSSIPTGSSWRIDANNAAATSEIVTAYALCANLPQYHVTIGAATTNNAATQTSSSVTCPRGVPVGGGSFSSSGSTAVNVNSTLPVSTGWRADMNNNSLSSETFETYVVCAT